MRGSKDNVSGLVVSFALCRFVVVRCWNIDILIFVPYSFGFVSVFRRRDLKGNKRRGMKYAPYHLVKGIYPFLLRFKQEFDYQVEPNR